MTCRGKKRVPSRVIGSPKVPRRKWIRVFEELKTSEMSTYVKKMVMRNKVGYLDESSMKHRLVSQGKKFCNLC